MKKQIKENRFFDNYTFLHERPEGMSREEYKERRRAEKKVIKQYLKGELIHLSKLYPTPEMLDHFGLPVHARPSEIIMMSTVKGKEHCMLFLKGFTYYKKDYEGTETVQQ